MPLCVAAAIELNLTSAAQPTDLEAASLARAAVLLGGAAELEHLGLPNVAERVEAIGLCTGGHKVLEDARADEA
eukprot:scaffold76907_cov69-Phaeocystis_antarctica.AAC.3